MSELERIKIAIQWLVSSGVAANQGAVAVLMGYKNKSAFSQILNGHVPIPKKFIEILSSLHPDLNSNWIITGEGDLIVKSQKNNFVNESSSTYQAPSPIKETDIPLDQSIAKLISMMQQLIDNNQIIAESNKILATNNSKTVDSLNLISQSNKSLADSTSQTAKSFESISESNLKLTETNQLLVKSNSELVAKFKAGRMDVQDAGCADVG